MNGVPPEPDVQANEARATLERVAAQDVTTRRDRWLSAALSAATGVLGGAIVPIYVYRATTREYAFTLTFVTTGLLFAHLAARRWHRATSNSIPRGTNRIEWIAAGVTVPIVVGAIVVLNATSRTGPNPWWAYVVAGTLIAAPFLAAGAVIARGQR